MKNYIFSIAINVATKFSFIFQDVKITKKRAFEFLASTVQSLSGKSV